MGGPARQPALSPVGRHVPPRRAPRLAVGVLRRRGPLRQSRGVVAVQRGLSEAGVSIPALRQVPGPTILVEAPAAPHHVVTVPAPSSASPRLAPGRRPVFGTLRRVRLPAFTI